jgi:WD40 repeat protein
MFFKQTYFKIHHMKISIHRFVLIIILLYSNSFADTVTEPIRTFTGHTEGICKGCLAFSLDGQFILSGSYDDTLKLWSVSTGDEIRTFTGHSYWVSSVAFSPDGQFALSGSYDKTLKLWSVSTGDEIRTFTGHSDLVVSVAFSPDGQFALSGSMDDTLKLWSVSTCV